jgi:restriction system protein
MISKGPPGSPGPAAFPPGRGTFYEQWFNQSTEARVITERAAKRAVPSKDSILTEAGVQLLTEGGDPLVIEGGRNETLYNTPPEPPPDVMLQAALTLGEKTDEGRIVEAVAIPWLAFLAHIERNPSNMHEIDWRKWEEIIAGAYRDSGYVVTLTNRSGDKGRDIIATKPGSLSVRYFDQVKAYSPGHPVKLDQVHSMLGVLNAQPNVSKGIITTTSDFAPGVYTDVEVQRFMPYRLDLRPKDKLLQWLGEIARNKA